MNLSESGALATFENALDVWTTGELTFTTAEYVCTLPVKVARAEGRNAGLAFHARHDKHKEAIALLLRLAAETHTGAQPS